MGHIQQRDGRWCIVDLHGKHWRVRTIPMPVWVKVAIDAWTAPAGVDGFVFRPVNRGSAVPLACNTSASAISPWRFSCGFRTMAIAVPN